MIPTTGMNLTVDIEKYPSRTYSLNGQKDTMGGWCDGLEAVRQAVYMILMTERYRYPIFSWNYGVELEDLYGKQRGYVCSELKRRIREALLMDDRITEVDSFSFSGTGSSVTAHFVVKTDQGEFEAEKEVSYRV